MALHQRFFEAAQIDFDAAKVMTDRGLYQPAIYHLQAYEKCIKSYFIFKEVNINNMPEATVYDNIRSLGHDTEESTMNLIKDIAEVEKRGYESSLPNTTDALLSQRLQLAISTIDSFKSSLDRLAQRLDLNRNYINNVRNYSQYVKSKYEYHQNSIIAISKQPDMTFLTIVSCMVNLYPCLYRMESISRYPLSEFAYNNLNLLTNVGQSCKSLIELLQDLITLI
jgi:HEPN domain-containing protein